MGKKHKKHRPEWRKVEGDYEDKPLDKPLKLVLKVGGSEVTELSGSGHDSSYYDDRSDHEWERHKEKKKKKKKKSEKEKYVDDEGRRRRKEEKKKKREREQSENAASAPVEPFTLPKPVEVLPEEKKRKRDKFESESEADEFLPGVKVEVEQQADRPVRACRTQQENECTPRQQLLEHFLRLLQRKDAHGFFAFPVTDAIAPGYSMIIKHPMDFSTMKDKIDANEYKTITEFKADFKLMCDNAMVYNRPETVYYKAAKKLLHTGFKMMSKVTFFWLFSAFVVHPPVHPCHHSHSIRMRVMCCSSSDLYELEGNACSLTDSTAEEHVLALVEHAADEARDRINSFMPNSKVQKVADFVAEKEETHPIDLSTLANKLIPGLTSLGFKDDRRHKVTFLSSAYNTQTLQNNSVYPDLLPEEMDMLYSAYGDETGVQCALSLQEFVKGCGSFTKRLVGDLLDKMTAGDHSKAIIQIRQNRNLPIDDTKSSLCDMPGTDGSGMESGSVLDFMSMKSYPDMSLDMLNTLGKCVKKEPEHEDGHQHFDDAARLLQEFQDAAVDRVGSRPSSNLSSLSNTSERDHHHLGSSPHLGVGDQTEMVQDPYEFLQSPEPGSTANS
uniref:Bromodomain-containing protein 9 n=1 Tax=Sinocyclocheilus anshuiensis TaxID=1608454 RepID=A0A671LN03_9TELE